MTIAEEDPHRMKMYLKSTAVAVLALGLAGCGGGVFGGSTEEVSPEQFLEEVRATAPEADYYTDEQLLDVGEGACGELQDGATIEELQELEWGENLTDSSMERIRIIHSNAVAYLCPDQG